MKRILSVYVVLLLIISILLSFTAVADAASILETSPGGAITSITYSQSGQYEEIKIITTKTKIARQFVLPPSEDCKNYRLGIELADATISKNSYLDVNKGSVVQVRYAAKSNPTAASIVIETTKNPKYEVIADNGKSIIIKISGLTATSNTTPTPTPTSTPKPTSTPASTPKPTNGAASQTPAPPSGSQSTTTLGPIACTVQNDTFVLKLDGINLSVPVGSSGKSAAIELREKEKLLQITIPGKDSRFKPGLIAGNSIVYGCLVNYNELLDTTIVRISWKDAIAYSHEISNGSSVIKIKKSSTGVSGPVAGGTSPTPTPSATPKPSSSPVADRGDVDRNPTVNVAYAANTITVTAPSVTGYKISRVGSPAQIVIDVPGVAAAGSQSMPSGYLYSRAAVSQSAAQQAKITLDTPNLPEWAITESTGKLIIKLSDSGIQNVLGGVKESNVVLRLSGLNISAKFKQVASGIVAENSPSSNTFTFMMPGDLVALGSGKATFNDSAVKAISTLTTAANTFLQLSKSNSNQSYKLVESSNPDELLVVLDSGAPSQSPSPSPSQTPLPTSLPNLVVLDPGHGGSDPGAFVQGYSEKNYNLDISLRIEAYLKQKGINVLMTRRTDTFISLDDRCKFANDNKATLFVSIHNNSMPSPSDKGPMVLYYPSSYKGKDYAKLVLDNMINGLGRYNMGSAALSPRGEIVVLRKTNMPSILAEIACMTNSDDLALLNTESFRQKVAENIGNSILQILNK